MRLNVRWRILPPHISPAGQIFVSCMGTCIDACMGCECVCLRVRACARACVCVCNGEIVYVGVFDTHIHLHPTATKLNYAHARTHARACARTHTHTHTPDHPPPGRQNARLVREGLHPRSSARRTNITSRSAMGWCSRVAVALDKEKGGWGIRWGGGRKGPVYDRWYNVEQKHSFLSRRRWRAPEGCGCLSANIGRCVGLHKTQ